MGDEGFVYSSSVGWFLVLLFGFFGLWLGFVVADKIAEKLPKSSQSAAFLIISGGFSLLGGVIGGLLFIP
jgi:hypothetical protein